MDSMALGLLSRRESRKDLWPRLITLLLYIMLICTLLYAARCLKMLVFDRLGFPLLSGILQFRPQIQPISFDTDAYLV